MIDEVFLDYILSYMAINVNIQMIIFDNILPSVSSYGLT